MCPWQRKWEPRAYRVRGGTGTDDRYRGRYRDAAPEFLNFDRSFRVD